MSRSPTPAPAERCGARTRHGGPCQQVAGFGTDHVGVGRCKFHGGATPSRHGRYSTIKRTALRELIAQHEADPEPLNILPELAAARALFQDFIERYDTWRDALLAWHQSYQRGVGPLPAIRITRLANVLDEYEERLRSQWGAEPGDQELRALEEARAVVRELQEPPEGKPVQVLDVADAYRIVSEVTKIAERIERVRAANAISRADLVRVMTEMGRVVAAHVHDPETLERIQHGWLDHIRVA